MAIGLLGGKREGEAWPGDSRMTEGWLDSREEFDRRNALKWTKYHSRYTENGRRLRLESSPLFPFHPPCPLPPPFLALVRPLVRNQEGAGCSCRPGERELLR